MLFLQSSLSYFYLQKLSNDYNYDCEIVTVYEDECDKDSMPERIEKS